MKRIAFLLSIILSGACVIQKPGSNQGIIGEVRWVEGNLMPVIGDSSYFDWSKGAPVEREVYIYEATKIENEEPLQGVFYSTIHTKLIKQVKTEKDGTFKATLPTGKYSVFVMEKEGLFANVYDGESYINPVTVRPDGFTEIRILVNYKAYY